MAALANNCLWTTNQSPSVTASLQWSLCIHRTYFAGVNQLFFRVYILDNLTNTWVFVTVSQVDKQLQNGNKNYINNIFKYFLYRNYRFLKCFSGCQVVLRGACFLQNTQPQKICALPVAARRFCFAYWLVSLILWWGGPSRQGCTARWSAPCPAGCSLPACLRPSAGGRR